MYSTKIRPKSEVRRSLPLGFISGKPPMTEDEGHIFMKFVHHGSHTSYDKHNGNITVGYGVGYVTMKTTYNYVLYFFVDLLSRNKPKYQSIKVTIVSYVIDEFIFQQAIHKRKKSLCLYNNTTRWTHCYLE